MVLLYATILIIIAAGILLLRPIRWYSVILFAVFTGGALAAAVDSLGPPKPIWAEWRDFEEMTVVSTQYAPGKAIWVWTKNDPPIGYELPWDPGMASRLQRGLAESRRKGREGIQMIPGEDYGEWVLHQLPPKADPPKERAQ